MGSKGGSVGLLVARDFRARTCSLVARPSNSPALRALEAAYTASEAGRRAPLRPGIRSTNPGPAGARGPTLLSLFNCAFTLSGPRAGGPPFELQAGHLDEVMCSSMLVGAGEGLMAAGCAPVWSAKASRSRS